jgi:hypothetical protein
MERFYIVLYRARVEPQVIWVWSSVAKKYRAVVYHILERVVSSFLTGYKRRRQHRSHVVEVVVVVVVVVVVGAKV